MKNKIKKLKRLKKNKMDIIEFKIVRNRNLSNNNETDNELISNIGTKLKKLDLKKLH